MNSLEINEKKLDLHYKEVDKFINVPTHRTIICLLFFC